MTKTTLGFVLHQYPIGESSILVTFFTRDYGLLKTRVKGGRAPKKQAILQPFNPLWIDFHEKSTSHYIQHIEVSGSPILLLGNYLFSGLYLNELLYYLLLPAQEEMALFECYKKTILELAQANSVLTLERILRQFEWYLLEALGLQVCFQYERDGFSPIQADQWYDFIPGEGFINTSDGLKGGHLLAMARQDYEQLEVLKTAKWIMRRAIDHLLEGRPIRSRQLYRS